MKNAQPREPHVDPEGEERPDLDHPKTDKERIRTGRTGESQPEDAASEQHVERGAPRHRS